MASRPSAERAIELETRGQLPDAIREWSALNRVTPDAEIEQHLVLLRHDAVHTNGEVPAPSLKGYSDPFPNCTDPPPSIEARDISADLMRGAIAHHGCLMVRGLIDHSRTEELRGAIDSAFAARESSLAGAPTSETAPWFVPDPRYEMSDPRSALQRALNLKLNAVLAVDSPRALFLVLDAIEASGMSKVLTDYFGEEVLLSVEKSTLRRVRPGPAPAWHQDGSFLGDGVHAIDVWVALSDCGDGTDAPGLEIVPRRLAGIIDHGIGEARTEIEITEEQVERAAGGSGSVGPRFAPGDGLIFDEMFLHRTMPGRDRGRYALELWSFGASSFPTDYAPIAL